MGKTFERKVKEDKPVLAICYDFDKTLSPNDMQAQGYIQSVGYNVEDFWKESNSLAEANEMDSNLAYMYLMMREADGKIVFSKEKLAEYGAKVKLFSGVKKWFERIRKFGEKHNVIVEHYVISSGLKEMIEGTSVAKAGAFEKIYASSFYYENGRSAKWPAQIVNYTNKTQFLFRIEKGVLDVNDPAVNDYFEPEQIRVPFRNMVYIGDSDTDIPCMKLVNSHGGYSIGVYNSETLDKTKVHKMMKDKRIKYYVPADYSEGTEMDTLIKQIIVKTAANEKLEEAYYEYKKETCEAEKRSNEEEAQKMELMIKLENSGSFARTHDLISQLAEIHNWTDEDAEQLCDIAVNNSQVLYILNDDDIRTFFRHVLKKSKQVSESKNVSIVKQKISQK